MLNLEAWMQSQEMYQHGMSQSQIARELRLDRTVSAPIYVLGSSL